MEGTSTEEPVYHFILQFRKDDKLRILGKEIPIPFSNRFLQNFDKKNIFKMFNLDINKKVALFFGGGEFGLGKDKTVQIL